MSGPSDHNANISLFAYRSAVRAGLAASEFVAIARKAWRYNNLNGITGLLVFEAGEFRQVIEGPPAPMSQLVARIACDPRHANLQVLRYSLTQCRQFDTWSCVGFDQFSPEAPGAARCAAETEEMIGRGVLNLDARRVSGSDWLRGKPGGSASRES